MSSTLNIALKFLQSKQENGYLSFIAIISGLGVVLGITALIIITSVMNGFEKVFEDKILGMVPHATVHFKEPLQDIAHTIKTIKSNEPNVKAVAPYQSVRAMTAINGDMHGSIINGILPEKQKKVSVLGKILIQGSLDSLNHDGNIILGKSLVEKHQLKLGDPIKIVYLRPQNNAIGVKPEFHNFKLTGVYKSSEKIDNWFAFVSLSSAFKIVEKNPVGVTSLRFSLHDVMQSDVSVKKAITTFKEKTVSTYNWKYSHASILETLKMNKTVVALLLLLIIIVSAFNIVSALIMMITEKRTNIAVLKSFGASNSFIFKIFMYQGAIIGIVGIALGVVLGLTLANSVGYLSAYINEAFNLNLFEHYFVDRLPAKINYLEVLLIMILCFIICLLATIYPAYKATKIIPARVLGDK